MHGSRSLALSELALISTAFETDNLKDAKMKKARARFDGWFPDEVASH